MFRVSATISFTALFVVAGFLFAHPAHAAVPVAVVQFDSSTNFELSLEYFLSDLLDSVEVKRAESTAAYELLKREKARVFTMCYFNMLIWDQADYIEPLFNDAGITARIWKPPENLCEPGKGTTTKCSYGQSTLQSINLLRFKR